MTDDKKLPSELGEIDWDEALSNWENESFVPEVAKDVQTDKPAALSGGQSKPPKPLYRPPSQPLPPRSLPLPKPRPPSIAPPPRPPPPEPMRALEPLEDDDESTLIADAPPELLRRIHSQSKSRESKKTDPPPPFEPLPEPRSQQATIPAEDEITGVSVRPRRESEDVPPASTGAAILAPEGRQYDPNEDTVVASRDTAMAARAALAERRFASESPTAHGGDEREPAREAPGATRSPPEAPWADERPASEWLDDAGRADLQARATWLEEEARANQDKVARARGLLACSELWATLGDLDRARTLAVEARDLAPSLALAHRQARALMPSPLGSKEYLDALDAEVKMTPAGPARVHSMLLAADALRIKGDDEGAAKRLDLAARILPGDARTAVARGARALARREPSAVARLSDAPELAPIAEAMGTCLRLRGVERKDAAPTPPLPNELLMGARQALDKGDVAAAAPLLAELASIPELASGVTWLAASLGATRSAGRADSTRWLQQLVDAGEVDARRTLIARAIELGNTEIVADAMSQSDLLTAPDRVCLATLAGLALAATDPRLDAAATTPGMRPLACAATALAVPADGEDRRAQIGARAERTAGSPQSRALVGLGRLLAASVSPREIEAALDAIGEAKPPGARAVALEVAARASRTSDVSLAIKAWATPRESAEERAIGFLAAALVAERGGDRARALESFKAARLADPTCEAAFRGIASIESIDRVAELNALADDLGDGLRGALARLEAVTLSFGVLPEPTQAQLLERTYRAAPTLPMAAFLAERIARRAGDVDEVLRWVRERRASASDPIEAGLDSVREALLVADREPELAAARLKEAHEARPSDVALRELYERMSGDPPDDRASWREQRGATASGDTRILLFLEAAHEYERVGDEDGALRCAEGAAAMGAALGCVARERAELRTTRVGRLADELLSVAKSAEDSVSRREAYERLATLDATARGDPASALLWHRSILEEAPLYKPSLRHLEHHLVGEGRDDELEPIASAIANALRGTGPGECTAHAELAARLRMRGAAGSWDATRDMVELAAAESEPSTWSLRMLQAHARSRGDEATFLDATKRLVDRAPRSVELAALLVRAGDSAMRLGRLDEALPLLERATLEDPGDVVAWMLLVDVRRRSGNLRGAADASESLARSSAVPEQQLIAWYDAGRLWVDGAKDDDRATLAFESAAAIDIAYTDVFDQLARIYASRKMQPELADLLERRMGCVTDPDERLIIEIRRGRVLFEAGDAAGARQAFEAALSEHPDDVDALSALTDLCLAQHDWDVAEQTLIRLARLVPTPQEQRGVYARLGELYSHHLLNLSRAEVALKEVLKRAPGDLETVEKLVEIHKRQNDPARAIELQQELISRARSPEEKRKRFIELAAIHETAGRDNRRAEQVLESARRELPGDVGLLRALAEFYVRHQQTPAVNILLDRASTDARRNLAAGRFAPTSFEVLAVAFDLRGKTGAARSTEAMLAALEGRPAELRGAGERAFDSQLDDLLAPDVLSPAMRSLLAKTGEALDAAAPMDLRTLKASPIAADAPVALLATRVAAAIGLSDLQMLSSPKVGAAALPVGSAPPAILLGEAIVPNERVSAFLAMRALKLVRVKASVFGRTAAGDLAVLVSAWLKCLHPAWQPQGINASALSAAAGRVQAALPVSLDPDVGTLALEVTGAMGTRQAMIAPAALAWANRVALLALGDPSAALDAIATAAGSRQGAPRDATERAKWIGRNPEARDLVAFAVSDAFAEARTRLGVDR